MTLRIAFDLDGVLADMDAALARHAESLFGESLVRRRSTGDPAARSPSDAVTAVMSDRQQNKLWRHVAGVENFWESLEEIESGAVSRLAALAAERRWELIFLTRRPESAGLTAQVQTQRWLEAKGFPRPSAFVVHGSRGRIAAALDLDIVVDDRPGNCLDVLRDSRARPMLICRNDPQILPAVISRVGIQIISSVAECLDQLVELDARSHEPRGVFGRVRKLLGIA